MSGKPHPAADRWRTYERMTTMKPYEELTYLGHLRRLRRLARVALGAWGMPDARLTFLRQAGNTLFRVYSPRHDRATTDRELFVDRQYLLRIHQPGYQKVEAIELELSWLLAARHDADLPVPEPVQTLDGRLLVQVSMPGVPGGRTCSLLRWLRGRALSSGIRPRHYRAQGRLMARLHDHAAHWQSPPGLSKRHWDWDGLFKDVEGTDLTASEIWPLVPRTYVEPLRAVAREAGEVMSQLGKGPEAYGLIHADLGLDANVLFRHGEAIAIDFDDSGYGYWVYDLAVALEHCRDDVAYTQFRDALLNGYSEVRTLPPAQLQHLDLFLVAWDVYLSLWATVGVHYFPSYREEALRRRERAAGFVMDFAAAQQTGRHG